MVRKIIHIDEEKCNGCGLCASACHEGAIDMVNGKAKLVRENFCDGFGDCLPGCPTGAISFEEREAPEYDESAVKKAPEEKNALPTPVEKSKSDRKSPPTDRKSPEKKSPDLLYLYPVSFQIAAICSFVYSVFLFQLFV